MLANLGCGAVLLAASYTSFAYTSVPSGRVSSPSNEMGDSIEPAMMAVDGVQGFGCGGGGVRSLLSYEITLSPPLRGHLPIKGRLK